MGTRFREQTALGLHDTPDPRFANRGFLAHYEGECGLCAEPIHPGQRIEKFDRARGKPYAHVRCIYEKRSL